MKYKISEAISAKITGKWGDECGGNDDGIPIFGVSNMLQNGNISFDGVSRRKIDSVKAKNSFLKNNDILIAKSGNPKICFYEGKDNVFMSCNFILTLRADPDIVNPKYLYYAIKRLYKRGDIKKHYTSTTIPNLNVSSFLMSEINISGVAEQLRQVKILDHLSHQIQFYDNQMSLLDNLVKARFVEMFGDRFLNDRGWSKQKLGDCISFHNGKAHEQVVDADGNYILITSKAIATDLSEVRRTNASLCPLHKNDIVMVMSDVPNGRALAKCLLIDDDNKYTLNQRICSFDNYSYEPIFLYYLLNRHQYFLDFNDGNGQTNLRKDDILNCVLINPPMLLQKRFSDYVYEVDKSKFAYAMYLRCETFTFVWLTMA